jgi:hypothetical protein
VRSSTARGNVFGSSPSAAARPLRKPRQGSATASPVGCVHRAGRRDWAGDERVRLKELRCGASTLAKNPIDPDWVARFVAFLLPDLLCLGFAGQAGQGESVRDGERIEVCQDTGRSTCADPRVWVVVVSLDKAVWPSKPAARQIQREACRCQRRRRVGEWRMLWMRCGRIL